LFSVRTPPSYDLCVDFDLQDIRLVKRSLNKPSDGTRWSVFFFHAFFLGYGVAGSPDKAVPPASSPSHSMMATSPPSITRSRYRFFFLPAVATPGPEAEWCEWRNPPPAQTYRQLAKYFTVHPCAPGSGVSSRAFAPGAPEILGSENQPSFSSPPPVRPRWKVA